MAKAVLQEQQRALLQQERQLAGELQTCLVGFEGADAYATTLRQAASLLKHAAQCLAHQYDGCFRAAKWACELSRISRISL